MAARKTPKATVPVTDPDYSGLVGGIADLLDAARRRSARAVNSILTATYSEVGRRIVQHEQGGKARAEYGTTLVERLSKDLKARYGRGFSRQNLQQIRSFYLGWRIISSSSRQSQARAIGPNQEETQGSEICQTPSGEFTSSQGDAKSGLPAVARNGRHRLPNLRRTPRRWPTSASWSAHSRSLGRKESSPRTGQQHESPGHRPGESKRPPSVEP